MKNLKFVLAICFIILTQKVNAQWNTTGGNSGAGLWLGTNNNTALDIRTNSLTRMYILNTGRVGINTIQPAGFLHVNGTVTSGVRNFTVQSSMPGTHAFSNSEFSALAHLGAGTIGGNGFTVLYAKGGSNAQTAAGYFDGKVVVANGSVGIGTNSPVQTLDVNGRIQVSSGVIQRGGSAITSTADLGLYSLVNGYHMRFVTNNAPFRFFTDGGSTPEGGTEVLTIAGNGNLGVGEANPYKLLTVKGDVSLANYNTSGSGSTGNGFSGLEILGNNQVPTRRGISLDPDPSGSMNFYVNSNQGPAAFNFKDGNGGATIMTINASNGGVVGIGTTLVNNPNNYKLAVNGGIGAKSVKVEITSSTWWPDYVFEEKYDLQPLEVAEQYISTNKHLPGIPDASTIEKSGLDVAEIIKLQMQKIEELTLYVIELKKENAEIKEEIARIKSNNDN